MVCTMNQADMIMRRVITHEHSLQEGGNSCGGLRPNSTLPVVRSNFLIAMGWFCHHGDSYMKFTMKGKYDSSLPIILLLSDG